MTPRGIVGLQWGEYNFFIGIYIYIEGRNGSQRDGGGGQKLYMYV